MPYHLEKKKTACKNELDARNEKSYDETHFVVDDDDGHVLNFNGAKRVSYADLASGRDNFTDFYVFQASLKEKLKHRFVFSRTTIANILLLAFLTMLIGYSAVYNRNDR